jgi:hypothetical protein
MTNSQDISADDLLAKFGDRGAVLFGVAIALSAQLFSTGFGKLFPSLRHLL